MSRNGWGGRVGGRRRKGGEEEGGWRRGAEEEEGGGGGEEEEGVAVITGATAGLEAYDDTSPRSSRRHLAARAHQRPWRRNRLQVLIAVYCTATSQ